MDLVVKLVFLGQVAHFLELDPNPSQLRDVVVVLAPERQSVVLVSDREYDSVYDLVQLLLELAAHQVHQYVHPSVITLLFHVFNDRQGDDPLATLVIVRVFPFRSDAFLKQQIVGIWYDFANIVDVIEHSPKVFNLKGSEKKDRLQFRRRKLHEASTH